MGTKCNCYFGGKSHSHPRLVRQRQLCKVFKSFPQIWNIDNEKHKEKEKVGDRSAEPNEKKSDRELERERENKGRHFFIGRKT